MKKLFGILILILSSIIGLSQKKEHQIKIHTFSGGLFKDYQVIRVVDSTTNKSCFYIKHRDTLTKFSGDGKKLRVRVTTIANLNDYIKNEAIKDIKTSNVVFMDQSPMANSKECLKWISKLPQGLLTSSALAGCKAALCALFDCREDSKNCGGGSASSLQEVACASCAQELNCTIPLVSHSSFKIKIAKKLRLTTH